LFLVAVTAEHAPVRRGWPKQSEGLSSDSEDSNSRCLYQIKISWRPATSLKPSIYGAFYTSMIRLNPMLSRDI